VRCRYRQASMRLSGSRIGATRIDRMPPRIMDGPSKGASEGPASAQRTALPASRQAFTALLECSSTWPEGHVAKASDLSAERSTPAVAFTCCAANSSSCGRTVLGSGASTKVSTACRTGSMDSVAPWGRLLHRIQVRPPNSRREPSSKAALPPTSMASPSTRAPGRSASAVTLLASTRNCSAWPGRPGTRRSQPASLPNRSTLRSRTRSGSPSSFQSTVSAMHHNLFRSSLSHRRICHRLRSGRVLRMYGFHESF